MYEYYTDKEFLKKSKKFSVELMNELLKEVRKEYVCQFFLVVSGSRNMITQIPNKPIDFDYNLNIINCSNKEDGRNIKETVRKAFNKVMKKYELEDVQDSKSSLTTRYISFKNQPNKKFSIDLAIVTKNSNGAWKRLIHEKTGFYDCDKYFWNEIPNSNNLKNKQYDLKINNLWPEVREAYLNKKNMYLKRNDNNHPSFVCYIEAINEVYEKYDWD